MTMFPYICLTPLSHRDDGWFAAGPYDEAPCFPTRQFAASIASGHPPAPEPAAKSRHFKIIREVRRDASA